MFRLTFAWRTSSLVALLASFTTVACNQDITPEDEGHSSRIRVVNSAYQGADAATAVPVSIDFLVDESTSVPGAATIAPNSMTTGTAGFPAGRASSAGYSAVEEAVHTFLSRITGTTNSLYQNEFAPYTVTLYVTPIPHTIIVAGIAPPTGRTPAGSFPFEWFPDDQFEPVSGMARVKMINAAPFASADGGGAGISATFVGAQTFTADDDTDPVDYRDTSAFVNPPPGSYTLTMWRDDGTMLWTGTVSLGAGEVRSFIVQSTGFSATPGPGNTKVTNVLDNQW